MRRGARPGQGAGARGALGLLVTLLAVSLVACTDVGAGGAAPSALPTVEPTPVPTSTLRPDVRPGDVPVVEEALAPVRLRLPAVGIDMPVTDVGVESNGQMQLPEDPAIAGWYRYGADADSTSGNVVLAAHVDAGGYPIGPLASVRELVPGEAIEVEAADGTSRAYVLESVTYYEKAALPVDQLFARDGDSALIMITCGGPFDSSTGRYRDNVVAVAKPV